MGGVRSLLLLARTCGGVEGMIGERVSHRGTCAWLLLWRATGLWGVGPSQSIAVRVLMRVLAEF